MQTLGRHWSGWHRQATALMLAFFWLFAIDALAGGCNEACDGWLSGWCSGGEYCYERSWNRDICRSCPTGKYQDSSRHGCMHSSSCKSQRICGKGDYIAGASSSAAGSCKDCSSGKYQSSSRHRLSSCKNQRVCGKGDYLSASSSSYGTCYDCSSGKYQSSSSHRSTSCKNQKTCGKGDYLSGASSSAAGSCKDCSSGKYQSSSSHRSTSCNNQKTCGKGDYLSASSSSYGTCKDCSSGKYQSSTSHRSSSCLTQPTCGKGQLISGDTKSAKRTCSSCPSSTYQTSSSHQKTSCTTQPTVTCNKGEQFIDGTTAIKRACSGCPVNTFQDDVDHKIETCTTQTVCPAGTVISKDSKTEARVCATCPDNTFQDDADHRVETCTAQTVCASGERISKDSKIEARTCSACPDNTFQGDINHRVETCSTQTVCDAGEYISRDSKTEARRCSTCPSNTFQDNVEHRVETCSAQTVLACSAGEYISGDSKTEVQTCLTCPTNTFQDDANHRVETCTAQTVCASGERISKDSKIEARTCSTCPDNTFQGEINHRVETCSTQTVCDAGEYISEDSKTEVRTCLTCPDNTFQDDTDHRLESCTHTQTVCASGEYISKDSKIKARKCFDCPPHTYRISSSHRETSCSNQPTCTVGEFISSDSDNQMRVCTPCPKNAYQNFTSHRILSCVGQPFCNRGTLYVASKVAERSCPECPSNTFQGASDHRLISCIDQIFCPAGTVISKDSKTEARVCATCPDNTFQDDADHRVETCTAQTVCASGERISKDSKIEARTCSTCPDNTFQGDINHRVETCSTQTVCDAGEYISRDSKTEARRCSTCPSNTFQDNVEHRVETCSAQTVLACSAGEYISGDSKTEVQTCLTCPSFQYQPLESHRQVNCITASVSTCSDAGIFNITTGNCDCDGPETGLGPTCSELSNAQTCNSAGTVQQDGSCDCDGPETGLGPSCSELSNAKTCNSAGTVHQDGSCDCDGPETGLGPTCSEYSNAKSCSGAGIVSAIQINVPSIADDALFSSLGSGESSSGTDAIKTDTYGRTSTASSSTFPFQVACTCNGPETGIGPSCEFTNVVTCNKNGIVNDLGNCTCSAGAAGLSCEFTDAVTCSDNGIVKEDGSCICNDGFVGNACNPSTTTTTTRRSALASGELLNPGRKINKYADFPPCAAGEYWNYDAFEDAGGCYPCKSGSFAAEADVNKTREGNRNYNCPEQCDLGFITDPGATSSNECRIGYSVRWNATNPTSCSGTENRATDPANAYQNVGFQYITDPAECEHAARVLLNLSGSGSQGVIVSGNIARPCHQNGGVISDGIDEIIKCTESSDHPVGFCGLEHKPVRGGNNAQLLVHYASNHLNCQALNPTVGCDPESNPIYYRPAGFEFVAICKIKQCNHLEMVSGADSRAWTIGPGAADDAFCNPNPLQFKAWADAESAAYDTFYLVVGALTLLCMAALLYYGHTRAENAKDEAGIIVNRVLFISLKVWDILTDWGFLILAVMTPRFQYLLDDSGEFPNTSYAAFKTATVFFCIVSTLTLLPDMYLFYERTEASKNKKRPPARSRHGGLMIVVAEDVPQFVLSVAYLAVLSRDIRFGDDIVIGGENVTTFAILSMLMSLVSMLFHIALSLRPGWFFEVADPETGKKYERQNPVAGPYTVSGAVGKDEKFNGEYREKGSFEGKRVFLHTGNSSFSIRWDERGSWVIADGSNYHAFKVDSNASSPPTTLAFLDWYIRAALYYGIMASLYIALLAGLANYQSNQGAKQAADHTTENSTSVLNSCDEACEINSKTAKTVVNLQIASIILHWVCILAFRVVEHCWDSCESEAPLVYAKIASTAMHALLQIASFGTLADQYSEFEKFVWLQLVLLLLVLIHAAIYLRSLLSNADNDKVKSWQDIYFGSDKPQSGWKQADASTATPTIRDRSYFKRVCTIFGSWEQSFKVSGCTGGQQKFNGEYRAYKTYNGKSAFVHTSDCNCAIQWFERGGWRFVDRARTVTQVQDFRGKGKEMPEITPFKIKTGKLGGRSTDCLYWGAQIPSIYRGSGVCPSAACRSHPEDAGAAQCYNVTCRRFRATQVNSSRPPTFGWIHDDPSSVSTVPTVRHRLYFIFSWNNAFNVTGCIGHDAKFNGKYKMNGDYGGHSKFVHTSNSKYMIQWFDAAAKWRIIDKTYTDAYCPFETAESSTFFGAAPRPATTGWARNEADDKSRVPDVSDLTERKADAVINANQKIQNETLVQQSSIAVNEIVINESFQNASPHAQPATNKLQAIDILAEEIRNNSNDIHVHPTYAFMDDNENAYAAGAATNFYPGRAYPGFDNSLAEEPREESIPRKKSESITGNPAIDILTEEISNESVEFVDNAPGFNVDDQALLQEESIIEAFKDHAIRLVEAEDMAVLSPLLDYIEDPKYTAVITKAQTNGIPSLTTADVQTLLTIPEIANMAAEFEEMSAVEEGRQSVPSALSTSPPSSEASAETHQVTNGAAEADNVDDESENDFGFNDSDFSDTDSEFEEQNEDPAEARQNLNAMDFEATMHRLQASKASADKLGKVIAESAF